MRNNFSPSQTYKVDFASVELLPGANASVVFSVDSTQVFREDQEISPITLTDGTQYMLWGADDNMPYHILELIVKDVNDRAYVIGIKEAPYPVITTNTSITDDKNIYVVKVQFNARKSLVPCFE